MRKKPDCFAVYGKVNGREQEDKALLTSKGKENVREQEITGKELAKKIVRENELGIEKGDETGVNNDWKRRERGIERDEIAVNNFGRQNVSEVEKTDKGDEKENYKRNDYDSKTTTCQQKVSERLITESRKWEEQNFF